MTRSSTHTVLQLYTGTEAQNNSFTGAEAELTYDSTNKEVRIHDGTTQGGIKLAKKATTLAGYGITDAGISSGTITLGNNSITPVPTSRKINNKPLSTDITLTAADVGLASAYNYKGSKTNYSDLPSSGNVTGDVWNVTNANGSIPAGTNYAWNGSAWDALGGDMSNYLPLTGGTTTGKILLTGGTNGIDVTGQTKDADTLFLTTVGQQYYYSTTNGGANNISNIPDSENSFSLLSETVRYLSATDIYVKQTFINRNGTYTRRKIGSSAWTAWKRILVALPEGIGDTNTPVYVSSAGEVFSTGKSFANYLPLAGGTFIYKTPGATEFDCGTIEPITSSSGETKYLKLRTNGLSNTESMIGIVEISDPSAILSDPVYDENGLFLNHNPDYTDAAFLKSENSTGVASISTHSHKISGYFPFIRASIADGFGGEINTLTMTQDSLTYSGNVNANTVNQLATVGFVNSRGYAKLASPALTGTPTAPTPATTDNSTKIATTAFVKAQGEVIHFVQGSGSTAANTTSGTYAAAQWKGTNSNITSLYNGLTIAYRLDVAGHGTYGTLLQIGSLDAKPVVANVNTMVGTRYAVGCTIILVYNATQTASAYVNNTSTSFTGCWQIAEYDSTNIYQLRANNGTMKANAAIYRYQLLFQVSETNWQPANTTSNNTGTSKTLMTTAFNPFGPIFYYNSTTTVSSAANITASACYRQMNIDLRYSFNTGTTLTAAKSVYLVCDPQANGLVKFNSSPITQTLPTTADGKVYIFLGVASSTSAIELSISHPIYWHDGTRLGLWTGISHITKSGDRGTLSGYETVGSATTINDSAADANSVNANVTVSNGTSGKAWTKIVYFQSAKTVTLGSNWYWANGEAPTIVANGILVCTWCGAKGIASFLSPS